MIFPLFSYDKKISVAIVHTIVTVTTATIVTFEYQGQSPITTLTQGYLRGDREPIRQSSPLFSSSTGSHHLLSAAAQAVITSYQQQHRQSSPLFSSSTGSHHILSAAAQAVITSYQQQHRQSSPLISSTTGSISVHITDLWGFKADLAVCHWELLFYASVTSSGDHKCSNARKIKRYKRTNRNVHSVVK